MGGFSNFALSFSVISILTGAVGQYGYGLEMGGPLEMTLGWPLATVFTLCVAASMAELCSAYPTSGAMYHWAADLGGPAWGWFVAWLNIFGSIGATAIIGYGCAQFVLPLVGLPQSHGTIYALLALILIGQAALNHWGVRLVAWLNDASVAVHLIGLLAVVGALLWFAPLQPVSFLTTAVNSNGRPYVWAFLLGLLQAQWTYTGYDASAHLAEETRDARTKAPWGIVLSVAVSGVAGYILLLALTLAVPSIPAVLGARDAAGNAVPTAIAVMQAALGERGGSALAALTSIAMWFCGLSTMTSASRTLFSLARDHGTPFSGRLRQVNPRHGTPGTAIWAVAGIGLAMTASTVLVPVVTAFSTVALYVAYLVPIALSLRRGGWRSEAEWNLGRYGHWIHRIAVGYAVFICAILVMPPNDLAGRALLALLAALAALYLLEARRKYRGPEWARKGGRQSGSQVPRRSGVANGPA